MQKNIFDIIMDTSYNKIRGIATNIWLIGSGGLNNADIIKKKTTGIFPNLYKRVSLGYRD